MEREFIVEPDQNPLFSFYEKLYFHEIEVRENLTGRLQIPLAITVSLVGVLIYILQHVDVTRRGWVAVSLWLLLLLSTTSILTAGYFFVRSWFGATYELFPAAAEAENYRLLLDKTYSAYEDGAGLSKKYLNDFLCAKFIACATRNTASNDSRSMFLHRTNGALVISTAVLAISFFFFFWAGFDSSQAEKPIKVVIVKPIDIRNPFMSDSKSTPPPKIDVTPPPPPPPPPTRLIREGVDIKVPPTEKTHGK